RSGRRWPAPAALHAGACPVVHGRGPGLRPPRPAAGVSTTAAAAPGAILGRARDSSRDRRLSVDDAPTRPAPTLPRPAGPRLVRYGLAVLATALAALVSRMLDLPIDSGGFPFVLAAVMVSAWYGGPRAGAPS